VYLKNQEEMSYTYKKEGDNVFHLRGETNNIYDIDMSPMEKERVKSSKQNVKQCITV
jgi:hypothetical protein